MIKVKEITQLIESLFPLQIQEEYDNSGLIIGDSEKKVTGVLLTIDIDEAVIDEAIEKNLNLVISHHPIIFQAIKTICGNNRISRVIQKAIKNDISIYAAHTNLDNALSGLNKYVADLLNISNIKPLKPLNNTLIKLVTFVPIDYAQKVRQAIFEAGAGFIGNYDSCSFNVEGKGTFRALENANPFIGKIGEIHTENEVRIETIVPSYIINSVLEAMLLAHPYEEVAYDIYPLKNSYSKFGAGIIGELYESLEDIDFLKIVKNKLKISVLKHSTLLNKKIKKVAICTGSGAFLINDAISQGAEIFISSEFKYNNFIDTQNRIIIVDAGHFETEIFSTNIFYDIISKNFSNFATTISNKFQNPIKYL